MAQHTQQHLDRHKAKATDINIYRDTGLKRGMQPLGRAESKDTDSDIQTHRKLRIQTSISRETRD